LFVPKVERNHNAKQLKKSPRNWSIYYYSRAGCGGYYDTALPLYDDYDIIEQPVDLNQLGDHYAQQAETFIESASKSGKPFLLYVAFAHMHAPMFHAPRWALTFLISSGKASVTPRDGLFSLL